MESNAIYKIEKCYYAKKDKYVYIPFIKKMGMFGKYRWCYVPAAEYTNAINCSTVLYDRSTYSSWVYAGSTFDNAIEILKEVKRIDESRKKQHEITIYMLDENFNTIEEK